MSLIFRFKISSWLTRTEMFCLLPLALLFQISSRKSKLQLNLGFGQNELLGYTGRILIIGHHVLSILWGQEQSFMLYAFFLIHAFFKSISILERNKRVSNRAPPTQACLQIFFVFRNFSFLQNALEVWVSPDVGDENESLRISRLGMKS